MSAYPHLFSPLTIRNRTFKNRLLVTAHAPGYAEGGQPRERYQAYHEARARGGVGLIMFGGSSNIARDSGSIYGQIYVGDDAIVPVFRGFAERIHRHGAGLMCQISHMGRRTSWASGDWLPTLGPSVVRDPAHHSVPRAMSTRDIARVVQQFAAAAARCRDGGLDGCEILATTHLLGQFLSPLSNRRADAYGGTLSNRTRFLFEVIDAVRDRVGDEFIVGVRYAADESNEGGMPAAEGIELARRLGAHAGVDFLNVNGAYGGSLHGLAETFPGMAFKSAPYVELARRVRQASGLPTFQAARLADPATANWAVGEGYVDMAGLTRPHMADPQIAAKLQRGDASRIRPCVGAGYCIDRIYGGAEALCVHNVSTGREQWLGHEIARSAVRRRIVVIGGGPAGLEAARVSALRGHSVILHEAAARLGGQILLAARAGWRKDMIGIADWLASEVDALGVEVRLNHYVDGEEMLADVPDVVVAATGGVPEACLDVAGGELAVTTWQLLAGEVDAGASVLVYDETGSHGAIATADWLAGNGAQVELVTPDLHVGRNIGGQNIPVYLRHLYAAGATLTPNHRLRSIARAGNALVATLWNEFSRSTIERRVDQVVVDTCTVPAEDAFNALVARSRNLGEVDADALADLRPQPADANPAGRFQLFRIGDALAQRDIHAAMLDANRLCRVF